MLYHSETVGIWKQLMDESRVDLQTLEMLESQFVRLKGLIMRLINRLEAEMGHISDCNEETSMLDEKKENPEVDVMSSSTMFTSPEVIDEAGFVCMRLITGGVKEHGDGSYKVAGHIRRYQHP